MRFVASEASCHEKGLLDQVHDAVITTDLDGVVRTWNAGAERVYGYSSAEAAGRRIDFLYFPEDIRVFETEVLGPLRANGWREAIVRNRHRDGRQIFVAVRLSVLRDAAGAATGYAGCSNDVTERKAAEEALLRTRLELEEAVEERSRQLEHANARLRQELDGRRRMEAEMRAGRERLRQLLGGAPAILYSCAAEGDFPATFVSENVLRLFGYGAAEFAQAGFWRERIHPQDHERVFATAGKILEGGNYSVEYRFLHADGAYRWVRDTGSVVRDESGEPVEIVGFWLDITDAKRRQEELQEQEKLHLLAGVLLLAQEEERKRISRELHDDLNQRLAVLALDVALLERDTPALSGELRERLHALKERVGGLSDGVRRIALRLHPARVEQVGLAPAVRFECEAHARQSGIQISFRARRVPSDVPEEIALCVYRVAQEALRNIVKHSGASCAEVYLEQAADELVLSVSDDGRGFDSALPSEGLGLISMRERIRMVNGVFALDSAGDSGTRIEVRVPMGAA